MRVTTYLEMKYAAVAKMKIVSMMNIAITGSGNEANLCFIFISVTPSSIPLPSPSCDISSPAKENYRINR